MGQYLIEIVFNRKLEDNEYPEAVVKQRTIRIIKADSRVIVILDNKSIALTVEGQRKEYKDVMMVLPY